MDDPERASDQPKESLRVGIVAADPLRMLGLQAILEAWVAEKGRDKTAVVPLSLPDVLTDVHLTTLFIDARCTDHLFVLLEALRRARPLLRMIVIGDSDEHAYIQRVIGAGARGYLSQMTRENEICMALEIVNDGSVWAPRKVLARLLDGAKSAEAKEVLAEVHFTEREIQVLRLLVAGLGNRDIATDLKIDLSTVKAHLSRLMRKVGANNRIELTVRALRLDFDAEVTR